MAIKKMKTTTTSLNSIISSGTTTNLNGGITTGGYYYPNNNITLTPSGSVLSTGTTTLNWGDGYMMNSDIIEYIDIFYQFMGIDMDYRRFSDMSKDEKKGFIRDLKLKKLIEDK
jgi:hypothetical protein